MASIWSGTAMDDHRGQVVQSVWIHCIIRGVEESQFQGKDDSVRDLDVPVELLHVLEALKMQGQDHGKLLHTHTLLGLLVTAAVVALELVVRAKGLRVAKTPQTVRNRGVLVHIHLQIKEVLILAAHRLAVEAPGLRGKDSLEDFMHPGGLRIGPIGPCSISRYDGCCGRRQTATGIQHTCGGIQRSRRVAAISIRVRGRIGIGIGV